MKIGILTSSRADFGIYLPLLKELEADSFFDMHLLIFGTHLSEKFGYTINDIKSSGFITDFMFHTSPENDTPCDIIHSMAKTIDTFGDLWKRESFDLLISLGDRYEMFSAVYSTVPFNIPIAHIHGGETTLGSMDNIFRHGISLASKYHFVSCAKHGERISEIIGSRQNIYNVGALSLDNLASLELYSLGEFQKVFGVNLIIPTILVTLHPETTLLENDQVNINEVINTLIELESYQVLITMPNADQYNSKIRSAFQLLQKTINNRVFCFENLGTKGYFSAMKYSSFLLGNSSSGIIEAASFKKWAINIGERQLGRIQSNNVLNVPFDKKMILKSIKKIESNPLFDGANVYYKGNAAKNISSILKNLL